MIARAVRATGTGSWTAPGLLAASLALAGPVIAGEPVRAWAYEEGVASWYGGRFNGRPTASGEVFDKNELTAAHRTLPFGTLLLVTNLDSGRQATLRVTDRGPFVRGRVLDCSEAGARALGFLAAGTCRARLEILGRLPDPASGRISPRERRRLERDLDRAARHGRVVRPEPGVLEAVDPREGPFAVQVGAFADVENARRLAATLEREGLRTSLSPAPGGLRRVRVGPFADRAEAERVAERLESAGHRPFVTRAD